MSGDSIITFIAEAVSIKVSPKHMPLYVAEFQFRHNNRFNPDMFGTAIAGCRGVVTGVRLS